MNARGATAGGRSRLGCIEDRHAPVLSGWITTGRRSSGVAIAIK
ncbi:hypothetical protein [Kovacikia minuta]|nr:hypothetical protein [Kovacikia minuta]